MLGSREFEGKVALVTGATSGIGKATALAFAQSGALVVVAGRRLIEGQQTVHEISERGGEAMFIKTDVSKATEVEDLVDKTVEIYGRLDFACNSAGVGIMGALTECSETDWDYVINVNLKGIWLSLKHEIPVMMRQKNGVIVNIASVAGIVGGPGFSVYGATKAGIISLTKTAAMECAKSGIRINVISPGPIKTEMLDTVPSTQLDLMLSAHPTGKIGKPEEVAQAALWLCSNTAASITGHNLIINGGYAAQ
ncbi:MAG: SDR family oxidoreductase [Oscillatoria princeps RMCB-10]|jgi:NAD(P)-dependent dehydrogenase (short-subunit alcohol dehydrogenase family)|nr:SDR family oxidoreductase [Oscillatoria princeps RMCB-10]